MLIPSVVPSVLKGEPGGSALARFTVVLAPADSAEPVVLDSAADADQATIAFHQTRQRLLRDRVRGELVMVQHDQDARALLREPLGTPAVP